MRPSERRSRLFRRRPQPPPHTHAFPLSTLQLPPTSFPPYESSKMQVRSCRSARCSCVAQPTAAVQADEYMERCGLSIVMKDAVLLLLENRCSAPPPQPPQPNQYRLRLLFKRERVDRPADPILFLAEYFELFEADQTAMQVQANAAPACRALTQRRPRLPCTHPRVLQRTLHYIKLAAPELPSYM